MNRLRTAGIILLIPLCTLLACSGDKVEGTEKPPVAVETVRAEPG